MISIWCPIFVGAHSAAELQSSEGLDPDLIPRDGTVDRCGTLMDIVTVP